MGDSSASSSVTRRALATARVRADTLAARQGDLVGVLAPLVDRQVDDARRLLEEPKP